MSDFDDHGNQATLDHTKNDRGNLTWPKMSLVTLPYVHGNLAFFKCCENFSLDHFEMKALKWAKLYFSQYLKAKFGALQMKPRASRFSRQFSDSSCIP